jgi:hypothetical protein
VAWLENLIKFTVVDYNINKHENVTVDKDERDVLLDDDDNVPTFVHNIIMYNNICFSSAINNVIISEEYWNAAHQ